MLDWLHEFFHDRAFFIAVIRGFVALAGALVATGFFPTSGNGWKVGLIIQALATFIPAGQQNPPNGPAIAKKP